MEFIDNTTGHIFSQQTYDNNIGWELKDPEYVFWVDDSYTKSKLSTNTFYIKQITPYINKNNVLGQKGKNIKLSDIETIKISCNSAIFKLISYKDITKNINSEEEIIDVSNLFDLNNHSMGNTVSIIYNKDNKDFIWEVDNKQNNGIGNDFICPFFVICMSTEPDVLLTNILIDITYKEGNKLITTSTVIRVGGVFTDESEKLMINSINMGVNIPKTILDAIYQSDLIDNNNDYSFNVALYNEKLREYLLNKTNIKNECGNYNGIINALRWFGWGKNIKIVKLLKTDNKILNQYVQDSFNSDDDVLESFYAFRNTSFISFMLDENQTMFDDYNILIRENQTFDDSSDFHGEGLPMLEDLFNKYIKSNVTCLDSQETEKNHNFTYYEPYYLYNKATILLKLAFLKYYFKKYFCPVHVNIQSTSVCHHDFIPDTKLTTVASTYIIEKNILCQENCYVQIGNEKNLIENFLLTNNKQYMDADYCHFSNYNEHYNDDNKNLFSDIYESTELNFVIPIRFYKNVKEYTKYIHYKEEENEENKNDNNLILDPNYTYNVNIIVSKILNNGNGNINNYKSKIIYNKHKVFNQDSIIFESLICLPRHPDIETNTDIYYWTEGNFKIDVCCNGKWFSKEFTLSLPKLNMQISALTYQYDENMFSQYIMNNINNKFTYKLNVNMWEPNLIRVNASNYNNIITEFASNINNENVKNNLINLYSDTYNLPSYKLAPSYYNVIIYYDIDIQYWLNNNCLNKDNTFNQDNISKTWHIFKKKLDELQETIEIKKNLGLTFDLYLMYGSKNPTKAFNKDIYNQSNVWYIVLISRETINELKNKKLYNISKMDMLLRRFNECNISFSTDYYNKDINGNKLIEDFPVIANLYYKPNNVDYRFLINRMTIDKGYNGSNKFPNNKILACSIYNTTNKIDDITNINLFNIPFVLNSKYTKFEFIPYSPIAGTKLSTIVTSKSNIGIIPLQESENKYLQGAYTVKVHYSIDGISTQTITFPTRFKIE